MHYHPNNHRFTQIIFQQQVLNTSSHTLNQELVPRKGTT